LLGDPTAGIEVGLIDVFNFYMQDNSWSEEHIAETNVYLRFLAARAQGKLPTGARFLRDFIMAHSAYKQNSIISDEIIFDISKMAASLNGPLNSAQEILLGEFAQANSE
jgi:glutamate--cysteine ligase catalytic subunit